MKPLWRNTLILFIVVCVAAAMTNPGTAEFELFLKNKVSEELGFGNAITTMPEAEEVWAQFDQLVHLFTSRKSYGVFSLHTLAIPLDRDYHFAGVFGMFIPLQSHKPFSIKE